MKYEEWSSDRIFHLSACLRNIKRIDSKGELIKIIKETDLAVAKYTRKDPMECNNPGTGSTRYQNRLNTKNPLIHLTNLPTISIILDKYRNLV